MRFPHPIPVGFHSWPLFASAAASGVSKLHFSLMSRMPRGPSRSSAWGLSAFKRSAVWVVAASLPLVPWEGPWRWLNPAPVVPPASGRGSGASGPGQSAAPGMLPQEEQRSPAPPCALPWGVCPSATANSVLVGGRERSKGKLLQFLLLWSVVAVTETPLSWTAERVLGH